MRDLRTATEAAAADHAAAEAHLPTRWERAVDAGYVADPPSDPIERDAIWDAALDESIRRYVALRERRAKPCGPCPSTEDCGDCGGRLPCCGCQDGAA